MKNFAFEKDTSFFLDNIRYTVVRVLADIDHPDDVGKSIVAYESMSGHYETRQMGQLLEHYAQGRISPNSNITGRPHDGCRQRRHGSTATRSFTRDAGRNSIPLRLLEACP
jgi:hypothetical protein